MKLAARCLAAVMAASLGCEAAPGARSPVASVSAGPAGPDSGASRPPALSPGHGFRLRGDQIVVDTFEVRHQLDGGRLTLVLHTDLGDATEVFVSVGRTYREPGSSEAYLVEYFNEAGTVGEWRTGRTLDLTATDFWTELDRLQRAMAFQGEAFEVASVSDSLKVDFAVYPGQRAPFERGNANLIGRAVSLSRGTPVVEKHFLVRYPPPDPATDRERS